MNRLFFLMTVVTSLCHAESISTTPPRVPPSAVGNEANEAQLNHARSEGAAYAAAVAWERDGAAWSARTHAGEMLLTVAVSPAEGGWDLTNDGLRWTDPPSGMAHLRLFPEDAENHRFVPGASAHVRFLGADGNELGRAALPAGIYPLTDAYGADLSIPAGVTTLIVTVDALPWRRHDPYNGDRYADETVGVFPISKLGTVQGSTASARAEAASGSVVTASNAALDATVKTMWEQSNAGAEKTDGDYRIDYAVEYSEAYWEMTHGMQHGIPHGTPPGDLRYTVENERTTRRNAHIEVAPRDARNGNFLPGLQVSAVVIGPEGPVAPPMDEPGPGAPSQPGDVPFMWHSWLFHYGQNWRVPGQGAYRLQVHFDAPTARRYGRQSGNRMAKPVDITFDDVMIKVGTK